MQKWLKFVGGLSLFLSTSALAQSENALPPVVRAEIDKTKAECQIKPGFITRKEINGDSVEDYILDYGKLECGGSSTLFCGSAGCVITVFASLPGGGYAKVWDDNARGIKFRTISGKSAMILYLHGSWCGKVGSAPCNMTLFWNGEKFAPAK